MKLHVAYLNPHWDPGLREPERLIERYATLRGWCEALARAGAEVSALQLFARDAELVHAGVRYRFVRAGPVRSASLPRFMRAAGQLRPDVVQTGGIPLALSSCRRRLPEGSAIVWQHHGGGFPRALLRPLYRRGFRHVDAFFFTASAQAEPWRPLTGPAPLFEIPEGSTQMTPLPYAAARNALGLGEGELLLWVGRLNANKDPLTVLRGCAAALREVPTRRLVMAYGTGELLTQVRSTAAAEGIDHAVRLLGSVTQEELRRWYSAADLFVLGSRTEGSGYALIEAMACGLRPVVTDIPPFRRIAGPAGLFWAPGDAASLAAAIGAALAGRPAVARERIIARFGECLSFDAAARAALSAYDTIRARRGSS